MFRLTAGASIANEVYLPGDLTPPLTMKICLFFALSLLLLGCEKTKVTAPGGDPLRTDGHVTGQVDATTPLKQGPTKTGSGYLTMRMGSAVARREQIVCLPVATTGFKDLIGFQYTMAYDSAALEFSSVRALSLPGYSQSNFGTRFADRGVVSTLWTDNSLAGVTLPAGHRLYEICFKNLLPAGERTVVRFQDGPTSFEVVNKDMVELRFTYADGAVISR